jgi:hypothetical protein
MSAPAVDCPCAVDIHVHAVPLTLVNRAQRGLFSGVRVMRSGAAPVLQLPAMAACPPVSELMLSGRALRAAPKNTVGRAGPTGFALAGLLYWGALLRHPELTIIACHGGGAFPAMAPRIVRNQDLGWSESDTDIRESVRRLHFDSVVLDRRLLGYLVSVFGADRLLLGSDLPFPWEPDPVGIVQGAGLSPEETEAVLGGNARRLYGPVVDVPCAGCRDVPAAR